MADRKGPKSLLSAEDEALWQHVTRSIRPTLSDKLKTEISADTLEDGATSGTPKKSRVRKTQVAAPSLPTLPMENAITHGRSDHMDRRTLQRLRRGKLEIDGRLDLHGYTQKAAHRVLEDFLHECFMGGRRTVLVITGKGDQIGGRPGVLKEVVPSWLNEMPFRQWVTGFSYAAPKDGGNGALYIRVKRRRA